MDYTHILYEWMLKNFEWINSLVLLNWTDWGLNKMVEWELDSLNTHTQLRACLAKHIGIDIKVHLGWLQIKNTLKTPLRTCGETKLLILKRNLWRGASIGECPMFQKFENGLINMDPLKLKKN
jgi:hypothetical protein